MDNIEKVRRKIKELQDEFISFHPKDCSLELIKSYAGYVYLDKVLSFLDTLEEEDNSVAERFAKIVRANLTKIDKSVQTQFEQLYMDLTGNKMYGGYND